MKKYNKQQKEALESVIYDIDELSNKPRRLFSSLRGIAESFITDDDEEELLKETIQRIDEFEKYYYLFINLPEIAEDIFSKKMETERELYKADNEGDDYDYNRGLEDGTKLYAKKMLNSLLNSYQ